MQQRRFIDSLGFQLQNKDTEAMRIAQEKISVINKPPCKIIQLWINLPIKIKIFFAWYDHWIGGYYDRKNKVYYFCLLPCIVIMISKKGK